MNPRRPVPKKRLLAASLGLATASFLGCGGTAVANLMPINNCEVRGTCDAGTDASTDAKTDAAPPDTGAGDAGPTGEG